jgi:hypothetical protein
VVNDHALEFLGSLERAEAGLLTWGLVDGFFSEGEIEQRAEDFLTGLSSCGVEGGHTSGWELIEALLDDHLLWKLPNSERYRTRMAESVRLFARLRQIFPDARNVAWRTAPNLVADYRLLLRPRTYPRRSVSTSEALNIISTNVELSDVEDSVIRAFLHGGSSKELTLSGFQVRAANRVLHSARLNWASGTVVCAGTGSGKTLAFYLPAYAAISTLLSSEYWTKCLAIYPRNELLKDQFREALSNARLIAPALQQHGKRKLALGALYGDVPRTARSLLQQGAGLMWQRLTLRGSVAYECPFVRCPQCKEPMAWLESDIRVPFERLVCTGQTCTEHLEPDEIRLTRERMFEQPPDVLFTSTEMLNQNLSSAVYTRLFGLGVQPDRRPIFVLLDEVHSYENTHGAHVALLLRRWRYASQARPHFVGLSATLVDASRFFADLVGVSPGSVSEISPQESEMQAHGEEYLLALRGDPSSGTSLLSTTIQAVMLLRRVLDPRGRGVFGRRVFVFTDNLDVINRLFHNLLDAEGFNAFGQPNPRRIGGSLANVRATTLPNASDRFQAGQNWALVEDIGHVLAAGSRINIGRTSSQDVGVDPSAEIIVATSSLEVGFDDPEVGAVIQHKAPQSAAAFLQRKGRAGRQQEMRPWTVVVLSDYGRDRSAYQAYDQLFSPMLPPRHLPLGNRAVLRMQAAFGLLDWLARRLPSSHRPDPWSDFSQAADEISNVVFAQDVRTRQSLYADYLRNLLERTDVRDEFATFLVRSLGIDADTVSAILWESPRAILTEVAPTLLRRLERGWKRASGEGVEQHLFRKPLPEFVPLALFGDLQLPELLVRLPALGRIPARSETMPLTQALGEFAPGRVSRRFGVTHSGERHWVDPGTNNDLLIDSYCPVHDRQELGRFAYRSEASIVELPVFRPHAIDVTVPPADVQQSSNAFLEWQVEIVPTGEGHEIEIPMGSPWANLLEPFRFHTHNLGLQIEVRRFATAVTASVGRRGQPSVENRFQFVCVATNSTTETAALGFIADVDGIQVKFRYPARFYELCLADERLVHGLRPARFYDVVRTAPSLDGIANEFQRRWLAQAYLSTVTAEALRSECKLRDAEAAINGGTSKTTIQEVLRTILQWAEEDSNTDDSTDGSQDGDAIPRRLREMLDLLHHPETLVALHNAAETLWNPIDATWEPWLRNRFRSTLGAGLVEAAHLLCPRMGEGTLLVDVDARPRLDHAATEDSSDELWLTEATIGGGGFVEEFLGRYGEDPRHYFHLLEAALAPSDLEVISAELKRTLEFVTSAAAEHATLRKAFATVRVADSHEASALSLTTLRTELASRGILPTPTLLIALNARVLRPGTNENTDKFLARVIGDWEIAQKQLGIDVDARVFAFVCSGDPSLEQALALNPVGDSDESRAAWRYGVLYGVLWPSGAQIRIESLRAVNHFTRLPDCDRLFVLAAISHSAKQVELVDDSWFEKLARTLVQNGVAQVAGSVSQLDRFSAALLRIGSEPIDSEALLIYARLSGIQRDGNRVLATIDLPEAFQ